MHTGEALLAEKQCDRLEALFIEDRHIQVEATWGIYQRLIAAYRHPESRHPGSLMKKLFVDITAGAPQALKEIRQLGRTLKRRAVDVLAYSNRPGTSNGPTEMINGRHEHLRGTTLGFKNLRNYIARSVLGAGGIQTPPTRSNAKNQKHRRAVDAVPLSKRLDTHPDQVVADEGVHLGGGEKSLSRLDSPHNGATIVLRSVTLGTFGDRVDPAV